MAYMFDAPTPEGEFRCKGTIPQGLPGAGKPCNKLLRHPTKGIPIKRCPRCHTEHHYGNHHVEVPVWPDLKSK